MRTAILAMLGIAVQLSIGCAGDGASDPSDLEPDGDRQYVFVTASEADELHVFDFDTLERVGAIAVGERPLETLATPSGDTVWAVSPEGGDVTVVDVATLSARHRVPLGARPVHSFIEPTYERIWIGNDGSGDVSVVDLYEGTEARVLTGNGHHKMALSTDDDGSLRHVYVSNIADATISVIDPRAKEVVTNVAVGPAPHGMDYSHWTDRVYNCSGDEDNAIEVLETESHTVESRIPLPARCGYLHVSEDGRFAYATLRSVDAFARVSLDDGTVETFDAGDYPDKFVVAADRAYVVDVLAPTATVVDLERGQSMATIEVGRAHVEDGRGHRFVQLFEDRLFVPNEQDDSVTVIDTESLEVVGTLEGIDGAFSVAVAGPRGGTTYPR